MKHMRKLVVLAVLVGLLVASIATAATWGGATYTANAPTGPVLGSAKGTGTYNKGTSDKTRVQIRLLKNGVQRGVIGTYGAPANNTTYAVTHYVTCSGIQYGTWVTQVRPVRTDGLKGPWVTSPGRYLQCG